MAHAIITGGTARIVIPTGSLITVATIAAIAGVAAALLSARRAARIDLLTAIAA